MLSQKLKNNPPRERGIAFPVGAVPRSRIFKLHIVNLEEAKACSPMRQHGVIGSANHLSREAATETEHQKLLSSLRDFRDYLFVFRGFTPTPTCCHRFAVKSVQFRKSVKLQNSRVGLRSRIASKKIGAAQ